MALLDLLKPKYKHPEPQVRIQAVTHLKKGNVMANIAANDPDYAVRIAAIHRIYEDLSTIDSETILTDIVKNDTRPDIRRTVLGRIDDQTIITDVALNDPDYSIRVAAVERMYDHFSKIDDQRMLADIAKNDLRYDVRAVVVKKLREPTLLQEIAKNDSHYVVRKEALLAVHGDIQSVADPSLLTDVIENDPTYSIRKTAYEQLYPDIYGSRNDNVLSDIIRNDVDIKNRIKAVRHVQDTDLLTELTQNDQPPEVINAIIAVAEESDALGTIALQSSTAAVRLAAIRQLNDENLLATIAVQDPDADCREKAIQKIDHRTVLAEVARNDSASNLRQLALNKLNPETDQDNIAAIARNDPDAYIRRVAIEKLDPISHKDLFLKIARKDFGMPRLAALKRLDFSGLSTDLVMQMVDQFAVGFTHSDNDALETIVEKLSVDRHLNCLLKIAERMRFTEFVFDRFDPVQHQPQLADIAVNAENTDFRMAAVKRLDQKSNQGLFLKLLENDPAGGVRYEALRKLDDALHHDIFFKIAKEGDNPGMCSLAIERLDPALPADEDLLKEIANNQPEQRQKAQDLLKLKTVKQHEKRLADEAPWQQEHLLSYFHEKGWSVFQARQTFYEAYGNYKPDFVISPNLQNLFDIQANYDIQTNASDLPKFYSPFEGETDTAGPNPANPVFPPKLALVKIFEHAQLGTSLNFWVNPKEIEPVLNSYLPYFVFYLFADNKVIYFFSQADLIQLNNNTPRAYGFAVNNPYAGMGGNLLCSEATRREDRVLTLQLDDHCLLRHDSVHTFESETVAKYQAHGLCDTMDVDKYKTIVSEVEKSDKILPFWLPSISERYNLQAYETDYLKSLCSNKKLMEAFLNTG